TKSAREARLHGAPRDREDLGCLGLIELEEISGGDDLAIVVAQRVDAGEEPAPALVGEDRRLGRWGRIVRPAILDGAEGEPGATAGRSPPITGLVCDDPEQPGPERGAGTEAIERRVGLDERVLDGILGIAVGREEMR